MFTSLAIAAKPFAPLQLCRVLGRAWSPPIKWRQQRRRARTPHRWRGTRVIWKREKRSEVAAWRRFKAPPPTQATFRTYPNASDLLARTGHTG